MSDFRCSAASLSRADELAGTASVVRAFLLIEHTGAWGVDALRDARLPDEIGPRLKAACGRARVRPLLIRRPDRTESPHGVRVFAAHAHPVRPWLETALLPDLGGVLDLDLAALRAGESLGLERVDGPLLGVCTHGKHDACCAERGRPVAAALAAAHPQETWEVSHLGGDRFAGNMVVLPHGLYYGRLDPTSALTVAGATMDGRLQLDRLRGRSGLIMPVQAAEIALRRQLGEIAIGAVAIEHVARRDVGTPERPVAETVARFAVGAEQYAVTVHSTDGPLATLTCGATRENPVPLHDVVTIATL